MALCENFYRKPINLAIKLFPDDDLERTFHAIAHVLQSIMGNFSYSKVSGSDTKCVNGKFVTAPGEKYLNYYNIAWNARGLILAPFQTGLSVKLTLGNLRFVTCGEKGKSMLAFNELLSAYDLTTWSLILETVVTLGFAFRLLWNPVSHTRHLLSIVKVFLEQGDPFLESVQQIPRLRWITSSLLLLAIVLSNGYKNTNVLNMILPRNILTYEYLNQLEEGNFSVYSRSISLKHYLTLNTYNEANIWQYRNPEKYVRYSSGHHVPVINPIFSISEMKETFYLPIDMINGSFIINSYWEYAINEQNMTELQIRLEKASSLHPKTPSLTGRIVDVLGPIVKINYTEIEDRFKYPNKKLFDIFVAKWFYEMEEDVLRTELVKCN